MSAMTTSLSKIVWVVKGSLIELQGLVCRARHVVKELAAGRLRIFVERAVENQDWQRDERKTLLDPFIGTDHCRHRLTRLSFLANERVVVQGLDHIGISREGLVLEMENVGMRCEVAYAFEDGKDKIGCGQLECETLIDQTSDLLLMLERVEAGNNTSSL